MTESHHITQMLQSWRQGDIQALNQLMPLVHDKLHSLARGYMQGQNAGHTLQATALINEAFLKLCDNSMSWQNRSHFIAIAARAMRQILVDHARSKQRLKRGGDQLNVTLHETRVGKHDTQSGLLDLENALERLSQMDERKARIVELNIFGGMTYDEIAEATGISAATVDRELRFSRAWLQKELTS